MINESRNIQFNEDELYALVSFFDVFGHQKAIDLFDKTYKDDGALLDFSQALRKLDSYR